MIATTCKADVVIPGVPEPQTWALLVLGFGLIGVSARRRQKTFAARV